MIDRIVPCLTLLSMLFAACPASAEERPDEPAVLIADESLDRMTAGAFFADSFADARAYGPSATTFTNNFIQSYALPSFQFGSAHNQAWGLGEMVQVQVAASASAGAQGGQGYGGFPASATAVSNVYLFFFGPGR